MQTFTNRYTGELPQQVGVNLATLERLNTQLRLNGEQQIRIIEQRDKLFDGLRDPGASSRASPAAARSRPRRIERLKNIEEIRISSCRRRKRSSPKSIPTWCGSANSSRSMEREYKSAEAEEGRKRKEAEAAAAGRAIGARIRQRSRAAGSPPNDREPRYGELEKLRQEEAGIRQTIGGFEQRLESSPQRQQDYRADHARLRGRQRSVRLAAQALRRSTADAESWKPDRAGERSASSSRRCRLRARRRPTASGC